MTEGNSKIHEYANELVATPRSHLRMELQQGDNGLILVYDGKPVMECYLTPEGMMAGGFMAQALGVKLPPRGESVPVRVSTGVLFRAMSIADLDYSVAESAVILERMLEEADMMRGKRGTVSEA